MNLIKTKILTLGIIIDTSLRIPPNTGVTYRLYFLSKKLLEKGVDVKMFLCNRNIRSDKDIKILSDKSSLEYHIIPETIFYNRKRLKKIIAKNHIDILQFEDAVSFLKFRKIGENLKIPVCLEMHDMESTLKKSLKYNQKEIKKTEVITLKACKLADKVICMTPLDFKELTYKIGVDKNKISLVQNPIDLSYFPYYGPNLKSINIIFIGNMFYWPNKNAVKFISKKVYPIIIKKERRVKFYLIGMIPKNLKNKLQKKNFIFTDCVNNINKYLKLGTIALCPVLEGSGMKIKILNYCASGLPVITTKIGASGYEKIKSLIIEDDITEYPNIILELMSNPNKIKQLGKKNRFYVEKYFDIEKISNKMVKIYKKIINKNKGRKLSNPKIRIPFPLWLAEKRIKEIKNKKYYIVKNGKLIYKKTF